MPNLSPISSTPRLTQPEPVVMPRDRATAQPTGPTRGTDRVELSDMAQYLSTLNELPEVRKDLVDRVRSEIEAGQYATPEQLDHAADEMIDELDLLA